MNSSDDDVVEVDCSSSAPAKSLPDGWARGGSSSGRVHGGASVDGGWNPAKRRIASGGGEGESIDLTSLSQDAIDLTSDSPGSGKQEAGHSKGKLLGSVAVKRQHREDEDDDVEIVELGSSSSARDASSSARGAPSGGRARRDVGGAASGGWARGGGGGGSAQGTGFSSADHERDKAVAVALDRELNTKQKRYDEEQDRLVAEALQREFERAIDQPPPHQHHGGGAKHDGGAP
ncbi:hypothetical protein T484DRAFT_1904943, partial [Baffinella frigidus]